MKIIDKTQSTILFGAVKVGELFKENNMWHMRVERITLEGGGRRNVVCLSTGLLGVLETNDPVQAVASQITVE